MDKRLIDILKETNFSKVYLALYEKNSDASNDLKLSQTEKEAVLKRVDKNISFKYFRKEDFFQHKENIDGFNCILNIAISEKRIEFILFFQNDAIKFKSGGPFGLLAKRMNPKIPNYYKIPFASEKNLLLNLKKGINLYKSVRDKVIELEK